MMKRIDGSFIQIFINSHEKFHVELFTTEHIMDSYRPFHVQFAHHMLLEGIQYRVRWDFQDENISCRLILVYLHSVCHMLKRRWRQRAGYMGSEDNEEVHNADTLLTVEASVSLVHSPIRFQARPKSGRYYDSWTIKNNIRLFLVQRAGMGPNYRVKMPNTEERRIQTTANQKEDMYNKTQSLGVRLGVHHFGHLRHLLGNMDVAVKVRSQLFDGRVVVLRARVQRLLRARRLHGCWLYSIGLQAFHFCNTICYLVFLFYLSCLYYCSYSFTQSS